MPSIKDVLKMSVQVIAATYASICAANLVGNLFDRFTKEK